MHQQNNLFRLPPFLKPILGRFSLLSVALNAESPLIDLSLTKTLCGSNASAVYMYHLEARLKHHREVNCTLHFRFELAVSNTFQEKLFSILSL